MSRVFITGSADGLGLLAAEALINEGHQVVLHARNEKRSREALRKLPGAENIVTGDLGEISEVKSVANHVNALGTFDSIIHNAGVYNASPQDLFMVNTIAPYLLTCLINKPKRLIYLSSDMHQGGRSKLDSFNTDLSDINYSDTKLHVFMLSKAVARKWKTVYSNSVSPGWVPTKMGGKGATDDLTKGYETQVWLSTSEDESAKVSGQFFYHQREIKYNP